MEQINYDKLRYDITRNKHDKLQYDITRNKHFTTFERPLPS